VSVSERRRLDLYERLGETLGREHAEVLMEYLPPVGWGDVARRHDVDALRLEMEAGLAGVRGEVAELRGDVRAEISALRGDLNSGLAGVRQELHEQFSRFLMWIVGTIFASVGLVLALIAYVSS